MDLELSGRVVAVTGASKGIGLACAQAFAAEGAKVALISRSRTNLEAALAGFAAAKHAPRAFVADLTKAPEARRVWDEIESALGPVDVLVNSAGAAKRYAPADLNADAWRAAMDAKFFSYIHACDVALGAMRARGRGVVVNIIGMGGKVANAVHLPGGAANAALMLATAGLAAVYGPAGVRVVAISPGGTLTGRVQEGLAAEAKMTGIAAGDLLAHQEAGNPLRRLARPEEIAQVAVFLASARASYVNGAIVPMDGGAAAVI